MRQYILKKIINFLLVLFVATICVFIMIKASGMNPVLATLQGGHLSEAALNARMERYGLNQPVVLQYLYWLKNIVTGNFGESVRFKIPVRSLIRDYYKVTLLLAVFSFVIAQVAGVLLGILSAVKKNTWIDRLITVLTIFFFAIPVFFFGMLFILYLNRFLPGVSYTGSIHTLRDYVERLTPPVIIMAAHLIALVTRVTRSSMIEQLTGEYVTALRAKGLPERAIIFRHALKNGIIPVLTIAGVQFGTLIVGAVLVESVFSLNGLGTLMVQAVMTGDTAVIQGVALIIIVVFQVANLVVDTLYGVIDPRIREEARTA